VIEPLRHRQISLGPVDIHVAELGSGPPVLFCHGFPDVWIGWGRQMESVATAGFRAIALDMRGYGRSSGPDDPLAYTAFHGIGDLVGVLDALDLRRAAVVGHDFGAAVAWYAALLRPDRFDAVFAISVPFMPPGSASLFEQVAAAGKSEVFYMLRQRAAGAAEKWADATASYPACLYWSSGSPAPDERWDPFDAERDLLRPAPAGAPAWADADDVAYAVGEFTRTGFEKPLNSYRSLQLFSDLTKPFAGMKVEQPAFFLWGEVDGLARIRTYDQDMMRRDVPGLVAAVRLDDVGHWPHREDAETTNRHLVSFLAAAYQAT
jgi:pimeloyl-ACP methyl ester carboxylesterase